MKRTTWMIILFWGFIGIMLVWQFSDYDKSITKAAVDHPKPQHYFFDAPSSSGTAIVPNAHVADVQQIGFDVKNDTPTVGSFTTDITLKNQGGAKAVGVQIFVRPFRGILMSSNGRQSRDLDRNTIPLPENDPLSQFGKWVSFPDLEPNQMSTQSIVFVNSFNVSPGGNPHPQITFETEKPKP